MEKLIELLNEYEKSGLNEFELEKYEEWWYCKWNGRIFSGNWENGNELTPYELCSKQYGFIKWLVENEKVKDLEEIDYIYGPELVNHQTEIIYTPYSLYDSLLMLLSIQDEPISFLISILK